MTWLPDNAATQKPTRVPCTLRNTSRFRGGTPKRDGADLLIDVLCRETATDGYVRRLSRPVVPARSTPTADRMIIDRSRLDCEGVGWN